MSAHAWLDGLVQQPRTAVLLALLLLAALIDVRTLRIPNWLTAGGAAVGLASSLGLPDGLVAGLGGALGGLGLGLALMLPMYLLGVMGAGDVKLMAMAGSFLGLPDTLPAVLCVFLTGGVVAMAVVLWRRAWRPLLHNLQGIVLLFHSAPESVRGASARLTTLPSLGRLPYGVSICMGTLVYVLLRQLGQV